MSIVMPCYNEAGFIEQAITSVLNQSYPSQRMELLVVDGGSHDGTREAISAMAEADTRLRLIDNPDRIKPVALNLGVAAARGDIVMRVDAHACYPADYIRLCVDNLIASGADNVGGFRDTQPRGSGPIARAIAASISSRFGSGGAVFRSAGMSAQWVDTVFGGCYWRTVFDRIGNFDTRLIRGQDREFNERLVRAGGRILFVPQIQCTYYARSDIGSFLPWNFAAGVTPFLISRITDARNFTWRNIVPPVFFVAVCALPFVGILWSLAWVIWLAILIAYSILALGASLNAAWERRDPGLFAPLLLIFILTHLSYGAGALYGMIRPVPEGEEWTRV